MPSSTALKLKRLERRARQLEKSPASPARPAVSHCPPVSRLVRLLALVSARPRPAPLDLVLDPCREGVETTARDARLRAPTPPRPPRLGHYSPRRRAWANQMHG